MPVRESVSSNRKFVGFYSNDQTGEHFFYLKEGSEKKEIRDLSDVKLIDIYLDEFSPRNSATKINQINFVFGESDPGLPEEYLYSTRLAGVPAAQMLGKLYAAKAWEQSISFSIWLPPGKDYPVILIKQYPNGESTVKSDINKDSGCPQAVGGNLNNPPRSNWLVNYANQKVMPHLPLSKMLPRISDTGSIMRPPSLPPSKPNLVAPAPPAPAEEGRRIGDPTAQQLNDQYLNNMAAQAHNPSEMMSLPSVKKFVETMESWTLGRDFKVHMDYLARILPQKGHEKLTEFFIKGFIAKARDLQYTDSESSEFIGRLKKLQEAYPTYSNVVESLIASLDDLPF